MRPPNRRKWFGMTAEPELVVFRCARLSRMVCLRFIFATMLQALFNKRAQVPIFVAHVSRLFFLSKAGCGNTPERHAIYHTPCAPSASNVRVAGEPLADGPPAPPRRRGGARPRGRRRLAASRDAFPHGAPGQEAARPEPPRRAAGFVLCSPMGEWRQNGGLLRRGQLLKL